MRQVPCVQNTRKGFAEMMLMASNDSGNAFHSLAKQFPGRLGWLLGPSSWKTPRPHLPWALDNDAFTCWKKREPFDFDAWRRMIEKATKQASAPLWALVPDVVADRERTIEFWHAHSKTVLEAGFLPAFAVQNGMSPPDVPPGAVVFVGGTTEWKWSTALMWAMNFDRVHIGRVNGLRRLWIAQRLGVESCDGTGYFRATSNGREARKLKAWLHHNTDPQHELALALP